MRDGKPKGYATSHELARDLPKPRIEAHSVER